MLSSNIANMQAKYSADEVINAWQRPSSKNPLIIIEISEYKTEELFFNLNNSNKAGEPGISDKGKFYQTY